MNMNLIKMEILEHSKNRKCYTICKTTLDGDMAQGVYTNRKKLYDKLMELGNNATMIKFSGVISYENKKFNYTNLLQLLNVILVGEKFFIYIIDKENKLHIYEIKKFEQNN